MKSALIMGASGDIGFSIVKRLAKSGFSVYCHFYSNEKKVLNFVNELRLKYPKQDFFMVSLDMLNSREIDNFVAQLFQVDALIFASGFSTYKLTHETTEKEMDELWQIHVKTPVILCQKLEKKLAQNHGRILFISSIYAKMGSAMESVYSSVKAAQVAFVKSYAKEVATLGITVNALLPGAVNTRMNHCLTKKEIKDLLKKIPMGRMAEPEEIASVANFLVSQEASYLTGSAIDVNGGWL